MDTTKDFVKKNQDHLVLYDNHALSIWSFDWVDSGVLRGLIFCPLPPRSNRKLRNLARSRPASTYFQPAPAPARRPA